MKVDATNPCDSGIFIFKRMPESFGKTPGLWSVVCHHPHIFPNRARGYWLTLIFSIQSLIGVTFATTVCQHSWDSGRIVLRFSSILGESTDEGGECSIGNR